MATNDFEVHEIGTGNRLSLLDYHIARGLILEYLLREAHRVTGRGIGCLGIVAAYTKTSEGALTAITRGEETLTAELVEKLWPHVKKELQDADPS